MLLLVILYGLLHLTPVQNWLVTRVTRVLSKELNTTVRIDHIDLDFFRRLELKGLLITDLKKDTLLAAGSATVNITDWFFLHEHPVIRYVGLKDALIRINRQDSVWNYQFLEDYFSGSGKKKKKGQLQLGLEQVELVNVRLDKKDGWKGQDLSVSLGKLSLLTDKFDLPGKNISIQSLYLRAPVFAQHDYTGARERAGYVYHPVPDHVKSHWNEDGWVIRAGAILIEQGRFIGTRESDRADYTDHFDEQHIDVSAINGSLKQVSFVRDSIQAELKLSARERCGFELKDLSAAFTFAPEIMSFNNLNLETPKSRLGDYYAMRYRHFEDDMADFISKVNLEARFTNSILHSDDIAYFAPELKTWKRSISLSGKASGTIRDLDAPYLHVKSGNTVIDGSLKLNGLPDIDNTLITFHADRFQTNYAELAGIIPQLKTIRDPDLSRLGLIQYKGTFTGLINDFVVFGRVNTALGALDTDLKLKLPAGKAPSYSGSLSTSGFDIGRLTGDSKLGTIALTGKITGSGFSLNELNLNFDGNVRRFDYDGYAYQNILLRGDFSKRLFSGSASINDPNLRIDDLRGRIRFNPGNPEFFFDAALLRSDFRKLGFTSDNFSLSGLFSFSFTGNTIDNFLGTARVTDACVERDGLSMKVDSLVLRSTIDEGQKLLTLQSNQLDARVRGRFTINSLPGAFQLFLTRYYPAYVKAPRYTLLNQDFDFHITTKEVDPYVALIDSRLRGFSNSDISGSLRLNTNDLNVQASVPRFSYDGRVFNNIRVDAKGNFDSLVTRVNVREIEINDTLHLPSADLYVRSAHDSSFVSIHTSATHTLSGASVNALVQTMSDGVQVDFSPSSFIINDKKWQLEQDGRISVRSNQVTANDVRFVQGDQMLSISTRPSEERENMNDILIGLHKINAEDVLPYFLTQPRLEGIVTGDVRIADPFGKPQIDYDAKVEQLRMDGDSLGLVKGRGRYDMRSGIVTFNASADNPKARFSAEGRINTHDSTGRNTDIAIRSENLDLSLLNTYLGDVFSDIRGQANTRDLKIVRDGSAIRLLGLVNVTDASLVVNYTRCRYLLRNESVVFNTDEIDFGNMVLYDTLGNQAKLSGRMYHRFFDQIEFDSIRFTADRLLLLNTTKKDNNQFYGKVIGSASFMLNGSADNMVMDIAGEPSINDTSQISILSGSSVETGNIDYIDFIQYGTEMETGTTGKLSSRILVNMDIKANPSCKIDVILDEATGDVIKGVGNGQLNIRVGNREPLTMNGRYDIVKGDYKFNFQTVLQKYFKVSSGSIIWSGDPYNAKIDIITEYEAEKVDFSNLSSSFQQRDNIMIVAHLTETLLKPSIDFEFRLPDGSAVRNNFEIVKRLEQFQQDKNELNKQVTSILLFNTFLNATSNQGIITAGVGYNVIASTIGGVVSGAVSGFFNKVLQKYVKNLDFNFDVNSSITRVNDADLQNNVERLQAAAKSNLVYTLLNGRLIITAGFNLDYNNPYANLGRANNVLITPDFTAEWILSRDGRVRVVAFNRTNVDMVGQRIRTGARLSYRKDAESFAGLFSKMINDDRR